MNYSRQREQILGYLKSVKSHPTAEEIYHNMKIAMPNISLGTVYRNLDKFSNEGKILRLKSCDLRDRFDGNTDHHYHGICLKCGKIIDIFTECFVQIDKTIQSNTTSKIVSHNLTFNIICPDCNKN